MTAQILSGREVADVVTAELAQRVAVLSGRGRQPGLATVLVGDDPASQVYVRNKHRAARAVGLASFDHHLPATASQDELIGLIAELNSEPAVSGMILQLPLPDGLDAGSAVATISPEKDADGLHPVNLGMLVLDRPAPRPATPSGIMRILRHYAIDPAGKTAVVVGRSFLVGRPLALMLGAKGVDATVVQAHSRTADLAAVCRRADILVTAIGRAGMFGVDHVNEGAVVVDVGTNRTDGGLVGDVDFEAVRSVVSAITPVPGGVGPMTIASLLANTVSLAERAAG